MVKEYLATFEVTAKIQKRITATSTDEANEKANNMTTYCDFKLDEVDSMNAEVKELEELEEND